MASIERVASRVSLVEGASAAKWAATASSGATATMLLQVSGEALQSQPAVEQGLWAYQVTGISLAVLGTCLAASLLRAFREKPQTEEKLFWKFAMAVFVAFVGGWLTVFLMGLPYTTGHIGNAIPAPAVGAVFTLAFDFLRTRAPKWIDAVMGDVPKEVALAIGEILKSWFKRKGGST